MEGVGQRDPGEHRPHPVRVFVIQPGRAPGGRPLEHRERGQPHPRHAGHRLDCGGPGSYDGDPLASGVIALKPTVSITIN